MHKAVTVNVYVNPSHSVASADDYGLDVMRVGMTCVRRGHMRDSCVEGGMLVAFSSLARIWGGMSDESFPACFLFCFLFRFLKWRLARAHQFCFSGQDQSTVVPRAKTTVTECSLTNFV